MSQIVFYLFVGENKGSSHITFMYEREREASRGGGREGGTTSSSALTSTQNKELPLSQRPGKVTLENKLKPLPIVMQPCHRDRELKI